MTRRERPAGAATRWVLPATILGSSLGFIDGSVVTVALPAIQRDLQSSLATMQWVINGYMLMLASLILLGGSAGDRFGRRRVFIIGLSGFALASLACSIAPSASALIAARLVQGVFAALLVPSSLAIIGAAYEGEARGKAIGTWAAAAALTTALGPPFGGWLVDTIGWRSIFVINLPLAALALLLALRMPTDEERRESAPLDVIGAALTIIALGLLSYGLIVIGQNSILLGTAAIILALPIGWLFIRVEQQSSAPMLPLSLFRNRDFSGANGLTILLYAALSAALFLLPYALIELHHYSATAAGSAFLPLSVIMGAGSRWAGGFAERIGARLPLVIGPSVTAIGYLMLAASAAQSSYWTGILPGITLVAIGMTLAVAPLTTVVLASAPAGDSGSASGINNAAARAGGLVAVAAIGLAFGRSDLSSLSPDILTHGYRMVMIAAAVLSGLSALTAAMTIGASKDGSTD